MPGNADIQIRSGPENYTHFQLHVSTFDSESRSQPVYNKLEEAGLLKCVPVFNMPRSLGRREQYR